MKNKENIYFLQKLTILPIPTGTKGDEFFLPPQIRGPRKNELSKDRYERGDVKNRSDSTPLRTAGCDNIKSLAMTLQAKR